MALGKGLPEDLMRDTRGYSVEEWEKTKQTLRDKGLFDADNAFTDAGARQREGIEAQTDIAAAAPYDHLGDDRTNRLVELTRPWARSISKQIFG
ncbi:MAG: hypothetical protein QOJ03_2715, partial [Frankiaceae bacterium]|nr:hypothetical protein [Frankiaceae bacterium]